MNKEYSCNKCGSVIYTKNKPNSECNCGGNWEEIKEIIVVENNQLENLCNEYPANEKRLKKLIKEKIDYYSKNPFNSKFKEITLENIKEKITLTNTLYKETTKEEENKEEFHNSFIWDENKVIQKRVFPIDQHKDFFYPF